jgi:hypothetical protein
VHLFSFICFSKHNNTTMNRILSTISALVITSASFGQAITDNGTNVGIGNASPAFKLDVNGGINLSAGNRITFGGGNALHTNGVENVAIGQLAGQSITTGRRNAFIGTGAGRLLTSGELNAFIGYGAGEFATTGSSNSLIGYQAGRLLSSGGFNTFIGQRAGYSTSTGANNVAIGTQSGYSLTTSGQNVLIGRDAGYSVSTGAANTVLGWQAGYNTTVGADNAFVGRRAGFSNTTGSNNTYIGPNSGGSPTLTNATAIGANASVTTDNSLVLGNNANVGIGTSAPEAKLHVEGNARITGALHDSSDDAGTAGQILSSTATGTDWIDPMSLVGPTGPQGQTGGVGANGATGPTGPQGIQGETGLQGEQGPAGVTGPQGIQGVAGPIGPQGEQGLAGTPGAVGPTGPQGPQGIQGPAGLLSSGSTAGVTPFWNGSSWVVNSTNIFNNNGNVGIGISTPTARLHMNAITNQPNFMRFTAGSNTGTSSTDGFEIGVTSQGDPIIKNNELSSIFIQTFNGSLVIDPNGNVGIGGATPNASLAVNGVAALGALRVSANAGQGRLMVSDQFGNATWTDLFNINFNETDPQVSSSTIGRVPRWAGQSLFDGAMYDNGNGMVGIGTSNPQSPLHVVGTIRTDNLVIAQGAAEGKILRSAFNGGAVWTDAFQLGATAGLDAVYRFQNDISSRQIFADIGAFHISGTDGFISTGTLGQGQTQIPGGPALVWNPSKAAFRVGLGTSNWSTANSGVASFATGNATKAQGANSVAFGELSSAVGDNSLAVGERAVANTKHSFAAGFGTFALSYNETVFGAFNTIYTPQSETEWHPNDRLFGIGSGFGDISNPTRKDALIILKSGNVGIGTSTPSAPLQVKGITRTDSIVTDAFRLVAFNANGRIMQADANGNASWVLPSSIASGTLNDAYNFGGPGAGSVIFSNPQNPFTVFGAQLAGKLFVGNQFLPLDDPFFGTTAVAIKTQGGIESTGNIKADGTVDASGYLLNGEPFTGVQGPTGPQGLTGLTGPQGPIGPTGASNLDAAYDGNGSGLGRVITADAGALHIAGVDGFLATGTSGSGSLPAEGVGVRMMWYPKKAAFRAGKIDLSGVIDGAEWNDVNIGENSVAMGLNSAATMANSFAAGDHAIAMGVTSISLGNGTTASGENSFASGFGSNATGFYSTAMGTSSTASGLSSFAAGYGSMAFSNAEIALGSFNTEYTPTGVNFFSSGDRLLVVGNGNGFGSRSDALVILKNGNTGIGTSTPTEKLSVKGRALFTDGFGTTNAALLYKSSTDYMFIGPQSGSASQGGTIALYGSGNAVSGGTPGGIDLNVSGGQKVRILSDGNVGIGALSPSAKLEVAGQVKITGGGPGEGKLLTSDASGLASWSTLAGVLGGNLNGQTLRYNGTSWTVNVNLFNDGTNVGIGTAIPSAKLMVSTSGVTGARVNSTGSSEVHVDLMRSGSDWRIRNTSGIFTIGQSNDNYATIVDVLRLGSASVSGGTDNTISSGGSSLRWTAVFATNGTINTSDAREKENVENLKYGLSELRKLRPVSYNWISNPDEGRKLGLIAQELQEVLPEVVRDWDWKEAEDGMPNERVRVPAERLGVFYSDIIPVLVNGIQELDDRTQGMDTLRLAQLEAGLAAKDAEIAELKAMMREILNNQNRFDTDLQQCCFDHSNANGAAGLNQQSALDTPQLEQNIPNPFHENTTIRYYLPNGMRTASIVITDLSGVQLKTFDLGGTSGFGQVLISGGAFAAGTYIYTLTVDGKVVDSKRMVLL